MSASSLFKHLALAAVLSVGGYVGSEALAPVTGVSLVGQAQAQVKYTGRVKNIRIKRRRVGSGFKVVARTQGEDAGTVASAQVALSAAGEVLDTLDLGASQRARVDTIGDLTDSDISVNNGEILNIEVVAGRLNDDGQPGDDVIASIIPVELIVGDNGRPRGEGVGENGFKARVRVNRAGALVAVVMHENKAWQGDLDAVTLLNEGGEPLPMFVQGVRQRRVATTDVDLEAVGPLQIATTLFDEDGTVIDARTETLTLAEEIVPEVSTIKVRETNRGDAKLVSITAGSGEDASLAVSITDAETGEAVLETVDDSPVSTVRTFFQSGVEFEPGESPANFVYLCLIDMIDANGEPFGQQHEIELVIPEQVEGEVTTTIAPFGDGVGQVVMLAGEGGYFFSVGVVGESNVEAVNIIFEEPYEGPAPLETEVTTEFTGQLDKWIQKGDAALPPNYSVSTTLTEAGAVVGGVEGVGGEGTGTVYKNGSGTKKASGQVSQQHFQLL